MSDDPRLQPLLDALLDAEATPEEVCAACPELLPAVRQRWRQLRRVDAALERLFPSSCEADAPPFSVCAQDPALPTIPGYALESVLGRGGVGIVYRARHLRLNRPVALKMLLAGPFAGTDDQERFQREAEAVAALRHPNIVQLYDVGEAGNRPYFTMELVEGGGLSKKLTGTPMAARQAAALVAALAAAIHEAHLRGIIHRDLKPANVLLTEEGTPKISDFGLARRLDGEEGLTLSGAPVGTPSYMAPEQARGDRGAIGPATDIYALGAILYELLTGRPPFKGPTAADTLLHVLGEEAVPPARLNPKVPRDLDTVCRKCLEKEPAQRYRTAAELADDLARFGRNEPVRARRISPLERGLRWLRRRPGQAASLAGILLLALALAGSGAWFVWEHTRTVRAVEDDLHEVARLQRGADWTRATIALAQAKARLRDSVSGPLRERVARAESDLELATRLDTIHLNRAIIVEGRYDQRERAAQEYQVAFREAGLGEIHDDPAAVADRIKASAAETAIVAALDDWATCSADPSVQDRILEIARHADPDPWRDTVRNSTVWRDRVALDRVILAERTQAASPTKQPVTLLIALAERLHDTGGDARPFLEQIQQEHPGNFYANFALANVIRSEAPEKALGYYRAALGIRPTSAAASYNLGGVLRKTGALSEAVVCYRRAVALDPQSAWAYHFLADCLHEMGQTEEAIDSYRHAARLDPTLPWPHFGLGLALHSCRRLDEAIESFRQSIRLDPKLQWSHYRLGEALFDKGEREEAIGCYRRALQLDPNMSWAHYRLGRALTLAGQHKEAANHFRRAAELEPNNSVFRRSERP